MATPSEVDRPSATMLHSRYYSSREVAVHNTMNDLWVSFLGKVYDLTPLVEQFKEVIVVKYQVNSSVPFRDNFQILVSSFSYRLGIFTLLCLASELGDILLRPILEAAGQDISHWFDEERKDIRIKIDQLTNCQKYHTLRGRFVHIPPLFPMSNWCNVFGVPWWQNSNYEVGYLTKKTRDICIINTLTGQEHVIEVCSEETVNDILERYLVYNAHAASYTWKYNGVPLQMDKTLEENGIVDEDELFYELQMEPEVYRQSILLYFNDDLTEL